MSDDKTFIDVINFGNNPKLSESNDILISNIKKYVHLNTYHNKNIDKINIPKYLIDLEINLDFSKNYKRPFNEDDYVITIINQKGNDVESESYYYVANLYLSNTVYQKLTKNSNKQYCVYFTIYISMFFSAVYLYSNIYKDLNI